MLKNMLRGRLNNFFKKGRKPILWNSPRYEPEEYIKKCCKLFNIYEIFTKWNTLNNNINRGRKTILKISFEMQMIQKNRGALVQNSRVILVKMSLKV